MMSARKPSLSVVVVAYNMSREVPRTLYSLSAAHQRHIDRDDYEVIVVDNGSDIPIDPATIAGLDGNFRLIRIDDASPSPAQAVNRGLAEAQGEIVGVMVDGARLVTPGLLHFARAGAGLYDRAIVATLGWYLGHDYQAWSQQYGYDRAREDALLDSIDWPSDGYRLFEIGTMDESSVDGWFQAISESNAIFSRRELWESLGGVDERFTAPGGGLLNLDTFSRLLELPDAELVILLGEGSFHQFHAGVSTNATPVRQIERFREWAAEYATIRGRTYQTSVAKRAPTYIGTLPQPALARMVRAALHPASRGFGQPLGPNFEVETWADAPPALPTDAVIAAIVEIVRCEFRAGRFEACCAVARLASERAPAEPGPRRLLSLVAPFVSALGTPDERRVDYHLALAEAHRILGENEIAASHYHAALAVDGDLPQAHLALAAFAMPGEDYLVWLDRLYCELAPESVLEIGVYEGASLALLRPPTIAIGVDPAATVLTPMKTETHIFAETSDEFFAKRRLERLLGGRPLSAGFIDGLHLFEQALKDFIGLESVCQERSVILIHDTVPLDRATQGRTQSTEFYTGDVWKAVLALKHYRPDLDIFTIATPPTGLTVVVGLDPTSRTLADGYDDVVARFRDVPFEAIEGNREAALNIVPNDWSIVRARLQGRQVM